MTTVKLNYLITILAQSLFTWENDSSLPELPDGYTSIDAVDIYTEGVILLLEGLDSFKTCGPYNILTRFIKETVIDLAQRWLLYIRHQWRRVEFQMIGRKPKWCLFIRKEEDH